MPAHLSWAEADSHKMVAMGRSFTPKTRCLCDWRRGVVHTVATVVIVAFVAQDILSGRARRETVADVQSEVRTMQDDAALDWERWRTTVPRTCAPSFTYMVPAGAPLRASQALAHCLQLIDDEGYVGLSPELMKYSADTLTLDGWSVPDCGLQFGDQLIGVIFSSTSDGKMDPGFTYELLGGDDALSVEKTAWLRSMTTDQPGFQGKWRGVNQSGELSMQIHVDEGYIELGNGQQVRILEHNSTHIVSRARDGNLATGKLVGNQLHWDLCETDCELERMPEYHAQSTNILPWSPEAVAIGNQSVDTTWWQDHVDVSDDVVRHLLFSIDASTSDEDLDAVISQKLQEHALEHGIQLNRIHVDISKLWIRDQTFDFVSWYDYTPPWQMPGSDPRTLYFPLEIYGSWESYKSVAHDWSGLEDALGRVAATGGTVHFLVHSVGAEPCFLAPPGEDHVIRVDRNKVQLRAFSSHYAHMVTKEVSGKPMQDVDGPVQQKTWSLWSSSGYNGDVWLGDANFVDHSHSGIELNFKVESGIMSEKGTVQSCDAETLECGEPSPIVVTTGEWMGVQASSVRLSVTELLNRSKVELGDCVDRCSIDVELAFENRLWSSWLAKPSKMLSKTWKGDVFLAIKVTRGNRYSSFKDTEIVRLGDRSMIHTMEHGGAVIEISVGGQFGYADIGFFLAHVGSLVGVLFLGLLVVDYVAGGASPKATLARDEGLDLELSLSKDDDGRSRSTRSSTRSSPHKSSDGSDYDAATPLTDSTGCDSDFLPPAL